MIVNVNFWDIAGEPAYFQIRNEFYGDTDGIMMVFDVQSRQSFDHLEQWLSEVATCLGQQKSDILMNSSAILVGNKVSLVILQEISL